MVQQRLYLLMCFSLIALATTTVLMELLQEINDGVLMVKFFGLDKKYKHPFLNESYVLCNLQKVYHSFSLQTFTSDARMTFWNYIA